MFHGTSKPKQGSLKGKYHVDYGRCRRKKKNNVGMKSNSTCKFLIHSHNDQLLYLTTQFRDTTFRT